MSDGIKIDVSTDKPGEEWLTLPNIPEGDLHHSPKDNPPKRRKLGIRFKKQQAREWGWAVPALDGAELYDVETGEAFEGVSDISVNFSARGPVKANLEIFVSAVDSYERPEEHLIPLKE